MVTKKCLSVESVLFLIANVDVSKFILVDHYVVTFRILNVNITQLSIAALTKEPEVLHLTDNVPCFDGAFFTLLFKCLLRMYQNKVYIMLCHALKLILPQRITFRSVLYHTEFLFI